MGRQFADLPFAEDMMEGALYFASGKATFNTDQLKSFLEKFYNISIEQMNYKFPSGYKAFHNYVDWLTADWTERGYHEQLRPKLYKLTDLGKQVAADYVNRLNVRVNMAIKERIKDEIALEPYDQELVNEFDPESARDEREYRNYRVKQRYEQERFRTSVIIAYEARCAVSDCEVMEALDAAHIFPHLGPRTSRTDNALLLRADLHRLFDRGLIAFDPVWYKLKLAASLEGTDYKRFRDARLRLPVRDELRPSSSALEWHLKKHAATLQLAEPRQVALTAAQRMSLARSTRRAF